MLHFFLFPHPMRFKLFSPLCRLLHLCLKTPIKSCTQIPLKILSLGCHLFSRGLDQIRPRAAYRKEAPIASAQGLENTIIVPCDINARASMGAPDTCPIEEAKKRKQSQRATLPLLSKVKCLYCMKWTLFIQLLEVCVSFIGSLSGY